MYTLSTHLIEYANLMWFVCCCWSFQRFDARLKTEKVKMIAPLNRINVEYTWLTMWKRWVVTASVRSLFSWFGEARFPCLVSIRATLIASQPVSQRSSPYLAKKPRAFLLQSHRLGLANCLGLSAVFAAEFMKSSASNIDNSVIPIHFIHPLTQPTLLFSLGRVVSGEDTPHKRSFAWREIS